MKKIYDISLLIKEGMIIYPGNPEVSIKQYASIPKDPVNESLLTLGSHAGTHVDAPLHIKNNGNDASQFPLDCFYGKCRVLDLIDIDLEIHADDLKVFDIKRGEIILLKTKNSLIGYETFREDFVHVKYDAAEYLIKVGVKTLGCDYLSVKKFGGDDDVHHLLINNLTLFEGLNLSNVNAGDYIFIGLPLRIQCDGAPARVILIED